MKKVTNKIQLLIQKKNINKKATNNKNVLYKKTKRSFT
jgi:hypothetical protein